MESIQNLTKIVDTQGLKLAAWFVAGASVSRGLLEWQKSRNEGKSYSAIDFFITVFLAVFSGCFFGLIEALFTDDLLYITVVASAGGFLGVAGLNIVTQAILDKALKSIGRENS